MFGIFNLVLEIWLIDCLFKMVFKKIYFNFFDMVCNSVYMGIGMWKYVGFMCEMELRIFRLIYCFRNFGDI